MLPKLLQKQIINYYLKNFPVKKFIPGKTRIPHAEKVFDENELLSLVESCLDGWWTEGRFAELLEKKLATFIGTRYVSLVNSGSSANLVALSALTSKRLDALPKKALKPGDEIITMATGFPTTVNPIIQIGCTPVFIDNKIETVNITGNLLKKAISKKTKAVMIAHTLGNPHPYDELMPIIEKYNLWFIEDCCDALGTLFNNKHVGTYGDVATFSFYPAHHMTTGEGGATVTNNPLIHMAIRQFRDWGRDCWCDTGKDNTCKRRFKWQMGQLPYGYDHKYIYSQIGYNLKLTDMQAALGVAQLEKLPHFIKKRKENFAFLYKNLKKYDQYFIFPEWDKEKTNPSWFGFMLTIKDNAPFNRLEITNFLENRNIATRTLYGGNLLKHPAYLSLSKIRISGSLKNSDRVMNNGFWIGVHPGLTKEMLNFIVITFNDFFVQLSIKK